MDNRTELEKSKDVLTIEIPTIFYNEIEFLFKDGDRNNWSIYNSTYRFKNGPLECPFYPGYFYIPGYSRYVVNHNGNVLTVKTGKLRAWTKTVPAKNSIRGGYVVAPLVSDFGIPRNITRHRVISLVFLEYTEHPGRFVINHKNGVGGDDRVENLEFCTHSQNTKHAYDSGLHSNKLAAIDVKNWITGFEKSYPSIQNCCDEHNLTHSFVSGRLLSKKNNRKFRDGWRFKRTCDQWLELDEFIEQTEDERAVASKHLDSGNIYIFRSLNEAARETKNNFGTVQSQCSSESKYPCKGWIFRYLDNFKEWPVYTDKQLTIFKDYPVNPPNGIEVYDLETKETLFFTSPKKASLHFKMSPGNITKIAKNEAIHAKRFKFSIVRVR